MSSYPYSCECGDRECRKQITLSNHEFDRATKLGRILHPEHAPRQIIERVEDRFVIAPVPQRKRKT